MHIWSYMKLFLSGALFTISVLKEKKIDSEKKILKAVQKDISGLMILEAQKKHVL